MKKWFIPSWTGDFRLEAKDETTSTLVVHDPTPDEWTKLCAFLVTARSNGWLDGAEGVVRTGKTEVVLRASVHEAGVVLAPELAPRKGVITAVASDSGDVTGVVDGTRLPAPAPDPAPAPAPDVAAVTVRRPTLCCPHPVDGAEVRASEVLFAFSTDEQRQQWDDHGFVIAIGGLTGHAYRICHRHSTLARRQGKITMDLDDGAIVHCYDWAVPPPEEVLAVKLILEHREPWLRNNCTLHDAISHREVFRNPLGDWILDGTKDAAFLSAIGGGILGGFAGGSFSKMLVG